jgi:hypothetical protein
VHLQFHAVLEISHVDPNEVKTCLHDCLVDPLLAELFTLLDAVYYEGGKVTNRELVQFLKAVNVEIKG